MLLLAWKPYCLPQGLALHPAQLPVVCPGNKRWKKLGSTFQCPRKGSKTTTYALKATPSPSCLSNPQARSSLHIPRTLLACTLNISRSTNLHSRQAVTVGHPRWFLPSCPHRPPSWPLKMTCSPLPRPVKHSGDFEAHTLESLPAPLDAKEFLSPVLLNSGTFPP